MNYLLDTNVCIALINGKPPVVRMRFQRMLHAKGEAYVSSVVAFELWYGVGKSTQKENNTKRLHAFFDGPIRPLAFEPEDARSAGEIRARLEADGKPIGAYDLLIAGQALRHGFTLVTANVAEFARIEGLHWQDWAKP